MYLGEDDSERSKDEHALQDIVHTGMLAKRQVVHSGAGDSEQSEAELAIVCGVDLARPLTRLSVIEFNIAPV